MLHDIPGWGGPNDSSAKSYTGFPIDRRARPQEIAKLIAFLLSDESSYTTGAVFAIDGGMMA